MATLHINVANQSNLSGCCPLPVANGTIYTCPLGTFTMQSVSLTVTGSGSSLTITGSFTISGLGSNYGDVTFTGTYVKNNGNGSGNISWTGTHQSIENGSGTWTSDTTIPEGKETDVPAKKGAHQRTRHAGAGRKA